MVITCSTSLLPPISLYNGIDASSSLYCLHPVPCCNRQTEKPSFSDSSVCYFFGTSIYVYAYNVV